MSEKGLLVVNRGECAKHCGKLFAFLSKTVCFPHADSVTSSFEAKNLQNTFNMYKEKLKDYESPTIDVLELTIEGVVCGSGEFDPNDWNHGQDDWFTV